MGKIDTQCPSGLLRDFLSRKGSSSVFFVEADRNTTLLTGSGGSPRSFSQGVGRYIAGARLREGGPRIAKYLCAGVGCVTWIDCGRRARYVHVHLSYRQTCKTTKKGATGGANQWTSNSIDLGELKKTAGQYQIVAFSYAHTHTHTHTHTHYYSSHPIYKLHSLILWYLSAAPVPGSNLLLREVHAVQIRALAVLDVVEEVPVEEASHQVGNANGNAINIGQLFIVSSPELFDGTSQ
jgi:hypothetical protein